MYRVSVLNNLQILKLLPYSKTETLQSYNSHYCFPYPTNPLPTKKKKMKNEKGSQVDLRRSFFFPVSVHQWQAISNISGLLTTTQK